MLKQSSIDYFRIFVNNTSVVSKNWVARRGAKLPPFVTRPDATLCPNDLKKPSQLRERQNKINKNCARLGENRFFSPEKKTTDYKTLNP